MKISTSAASPDAATADLLAVAVTKPVVLDGAAATLDEALGGEISRLVKAGEIRGSAGQLTLLHSEGRGVRAKRVAVVGLGSAEKADAESIRNAAGAATRALAGVRGRSIAVVADGLPLPAAEAARCIVDGVVIAGYRFDAYKTRNRAGLPKPPTSLTILTAERAAGAAARRAAVSAEAVNRARDLQHTPPNVLGPEQLAERARAIAAAHPTLRVEVWDERKIAARGMGAFAAVAQASSKPARLIVLRHTPRRPGKREQPVLGMVGKGLTYDSGGYTLKPGASMIGMKFDMSGAAAVLEATAAIAQLELPLRFVTVVGATENMIDTNAVRVDDVVTAANGKTIEITNTDAEGRLVLADCLHHARSLGATHLVDLATLTGGVVTALGDYYAGLMGSDQEWIDRITAAGERAGEPTWQLPLHDSFRRLIRSDIADMANSSTMRMAIPSYAGQFLKEFAGEGAWAHLDIAGTADLTRSRGDYMGKGGTGYGVRLLVELAESLLLMALDLDLSDEHALFRDTVRDFAERRIGPQAQRLDERGEFPVELVREAAELGLLGIPLPERWGGAGSDTLAYAIAIEELARVDSSFAITVAAHTSLGTMPIHLFGSPDQQQRWLPDLASGRRLASFGLTEAGAGSDAGATRTTARLEDGEWVVDGSKMFITNAGTELSALVTVTARTGEDEISNIVIENGTAGYSQSPPLKKMGWRSSDTRELTFSGCRVPQDNLLGPRGGGFRQFLEILDGGRIGVAALGLGMAQGAFEMGLRYAQEREQFGRPIGRFQAIQFKLADMATEIEAGRGLVYKAAWLKDQGRPFAQQAAIAKLYTGELARRACNESLQIHGGYGFMDEYPISRFYRDAKVLEIGEGTNEIQRLVIARGLGL